MASKSKPDDTYTDPELRARLKDEIEAGDKGGKPGQWSARKAQLLVRAYEQAGGGYVDEGHKSEKQRHLEQWGDQDWHGKDGDGDAHGGRYLPDAAWKLLTPKEREATDARKRKGDEQHVANTDAAKEARKAAELLDLTVAEAKKAIATMSPSEARRAKKAETKLGNGRKTVLDALEKRL